MFKIDKTKVGDVQVIETITPCKVDVDFHFDINGERNISKFVVIIYFDRIIEDRTRVMKKVEVEPYSSAINTGQDNDDFWLNVNDLIGSGIDHRLFNVPQEERHVVIEEIFKTVEKTVETLGIQVEN